jgi:hypothetical protein
LPFVAYAAYCTNLFTKITALKATNIANIIDAVIAVTIKVNATENKDKVKDKVKDKDKVKKDKTDNV